MDTPKKTTPPPAVKKAREGRSPAFPFIDLSKALERADQFRAAEGKHLVPVTSAMKSWNLGEETSSGRRTVAALGHFGLFIDEGIGEARKVRLSELALNILLDNQPASPERDDLIRKAAIAPPIHKELWEKWGNALPSEATIQTYLVRDRGFSAAGASDLIREYKSTLSFAKLDQSVNMLDGMPDNKQVDVGDFVQVEIGGALTLAAPALVRAIQEHEGQKWVFIEGSDTGVPMEHVVLQTKGGVTPPANIPRIPPTLPESLGNRPLEREWLRGPLSKDVSYRLLVSGDLGPREIGKLIKLLKAQQSVLEEDDGESGLSDND